MASYIHRVGRTARYVSSGKGLLLLLPSEREGMLAQVSGWEGRHEWYEEWRALLQGCAPERWPERVIGRSLAASPTVSCAALLLAGAARAGR